MQDELAAQRVGTWLREKYRLDAVIGVGGMAAVYRGAHRNGNRVAVKVLHAELSINAEIRDRFLKEGYVANAVEHPGAVRVIDDDTTDDGAVFLVMELLEGDTLASRWEAANRRLPAREVAELASQVLGVLGAAHAKGIVHRDIKPENLFLTRDGLVKVLDFGIARMRDSSRAATRTGRMMGTPAFMPKEQALGLSKEIDGRTDLWALGATMFTLISGRYVHDAETPESMIVFTATRPAPPLASVMPEVPAALAKVIDRALAFEMADRFPDAPAMLVELQAVQRAPPGGPSEALAARNPLAQSVVSPDTTRSPFAPLHTLPSHGEPANAGGPGVVAPDLAKLGSDRTIPHRVSTTAGVSSARSAPPPAGAARSDAPPRPPPDRSRAKLTIAISSALLVLPAVVGGAVWMRSRPAPGPAPESRTSPSEQAGVATSTATATAGVDPAPVVANEAGAPLVAEAEPAPAAAAKPPSARPREAGAPRAKPTSAAPDCSPPFYYEADGRKKVKPGC